MKLRSGFVSTWDETCLLAHGLPELCAEFSSNGTLAINRRGDFLGGGDERGRFSVYSTGATLISACDGAVAAGITRALQKQCARSLDWRVGLYQ